MPGPDGRFLKGEHWRPKKPHWDEDWLREQYVVRGRSAPDIAAEIGTTFSTIFHWLRKHGIPRRSVSEARALKHWGAYGEDNPMYGRRGAESPRFVDGSAPERQRMYWRAEGRGFLRETLERDEYRCRRCSAGHRGKGSLHVHHIKPWAGNEDLRFDPGNVVTLCRPCHLWVHSKANAEREYLDE